MSSVTVLSSISEGFSLANCSVKLASVLKYEKKLLESTTVTQVSNRAKSLRYEIASDFSEFSSFFSGSSSSFGRSNVNVSATYT